MLSITGGVVVVTLYVSSTPVGIVLDSGWFGTSTIPWPDDTRSRLYVPLVAAEIVTVYVSPDTSETSVAGWVALIPLPVLSGDKTKSVLSTPTTILLKNTL